MRIQGKEKTSLSIDYKNKLLKKNSNIMYIHLPFYGFEKLNNLEKTYSRKKNFWSKILLFKKIITIAVIIEYDNGKNIC